MKKGRKVSIKVQLGSTSIKPIKDNITESVEVVDTPDILAIKVEVTPQPHKVTRRSARTPPTAKLEKLAK
jgi:hypothetical protein